jgi:hypothetical protein
MKITSSTTRSVCAPSNLIDLGGMTFFNSIDKPDQWFCFDFQERTINLTHYSIRTYERADYNPRSWVIETSMDGTAWTEVDRKANVGDLRVAYQTRSFQLETASECHFLRFRQTDTNHAGTGDLCMTVFEVFGAVIERNVE